MNIYDIAKLAGVSIATVSRVVNGSPKVSDKTKKKVLAVMRETEYTPNVFARGLGLDSMKTVGIMCPDVSDAYMAKAVSCLEKRLHKYGYDCILGCSGYEQEEKENYMRLLLSKRIDTIVMVGSTYAGDGQHTEDTDYIRNAAEKTPIFIINGYVAGENIYCIYADDFKAMYELTTSYVKQGKKQILFLSNAHSFSAKQKLQGYKAALLDAGYKVQGALEIYMKNEIQHAKDTLLAYPNLKFDSVVATEDGLAIAALKYAKVRKMKVPRDLFVAGYNNSDLAVCYEPELTSVDSKVDTLCKMTIDNMLALLERKEEISQKISIPCEIIKRSTTDF